MHQYGLLLQPSVVVAGFSVVELESDVTSADQQDYTTGSFTPTADRLLIAVISTRDDSAEPPKPTASGGSLTWTLITDGSVEGDRVYNTVGTPRSRLTAFWADSGASPSSMTVTFDYPSGTQDSAAWSVYEIDGTDRDATAFVQVVLGSGDAATSGAITLAAFADTDNRPFGFTAHDKNETKTVSTSFTAITNNSVATQNVSLLTEWRDAVDTTLNPTWTTSGDWGGFAIEIALAGAAPAEPEFTLEVASESDVGTNTPLTAEPVVAVEVGSESDTGTDTPLTAEPVIAVESGSESDTAIDTPLSIEPVVAVEVGSEADTATDVAFTIEPVIAVESGSESNTGTDSALLPEPVVNVETSTESDTAVDTPITAEPLFTVEEGSESDVASAVEYGPDFALEPASESDVAGEMVFIVEPAFDVEQATESDVANAVALSPEPLLTVETSNESDVAIEVVLDPDTPQLTFTHFQPADFDASNDNEQRPNTIHTTGPSTTRANLGPAKATMED